MQDSYVIGDVNPLMTTIAIWVELYSILCLQTGLSCHL